MNKTEAFQRLITMNEFLKKLAGDMKTSFGDRSNVFADVAKDFSARVSKARLDLIYYLESLYRDGYAPNTRNDPKKLVELMNTSMEKKGDFNEFVIQKYFEDLAKNPESLKQMSLEYLRSEVDTFLPYVRTDSYQGPARLDDIVQKKILKLKASTWEDSRWSSGLRTWNVKPHVLSLEKLLEVAAGANPITIQPRNIDIGIYFHMDINDPQFFYRKTLITHRTIKSYRFYKNGSFIIEFKTVDDATKAGATLLGVSPLKTEKPLTTLMQEVKS